MSMEQTDLTKNVLVVDSDQAMQQTLTGILKNPVGFLNVFAATTTRQAIKLLQKTPIDLVVVAIRFPTIDVFRIVAKFTRNFPSITLIVITKDAHPLLRASITRFPTAIHLDQSLDISLLRKRIFTELQIDYGGHIRGISISSILQMLELEACTCTLKITAKKLIGFLWFKEGELIAAKSSTEKGKEAALDIISWNNVFIDIDYGRHEIKRQITSPLMSLIIESGQRGDELRSSGKKSRHHERYNLDVAIDCKSGNMTRQCSLHNISLSGAYIETDQQIKLHQNIILVLNSPTIQTSCSIDASVVYREGKGAGVHFRINCPEQEQMIKILIDSSRKARRRKARKKMVKTKVT